MYKGHTVLKIRILLSKNLRVIFSFWGKDILVPPSLTFGQFRPTRFTIKTLQNHKVCILDSSTPQGLHFGQFRPCGSELSKSQTLYVFSSSKVLALHT